MARGDRIGFTLEVGSYGEADLLVTAFQGREALSEPFAFSLEAWPASGEPQPLSDLVTQEATVHLRRTDGAERVVHGEVVGARLLGVVAGRPRYELRIGPRLLRLGAAARSRVFQAKKLVEVVQAVLDEHGVKHSGSPSGSYVTREYVVQHQETDLAFVSRLLEEDGIGYRFDHAAGGHDLVLFDDPGTGPSLADPIPHRREEDGEGGDWADRLVEVQRAVTGKVTLRDYDFTRPAQDLGQSKGSGDLERYEVPGGYLAAAEGKRRAGVRVEELGVPGATWEGRTSSLGLAPGTAFEVDPAGALRCVVLLWEGRQTPAGLGAHLAAGEIAAFHAARFVALPKDAPWRPPRRTPRPRIPGVETGVVVGTAGEEIEVDQHGRIKVQLHWDREGKKDQRASCWMRLAQRWAGPAWGASFVPRIGQEVLVRFLGGDPDRPVVVGAVYDGQAAPPVPLPDEKTKSTLRTASSPGSGGSNELLLEDAAGDEQIYAHAQKDANAVVENDATAEVKGFAALVVEKDRTQEVHANQTLAVKLSDATRVDGKEALTVSRDRRTTVGARHSENVAGAQTESVGGFQNVGVALASAESVLGAAALNIGGAYLVNVGGAHNTAVGGVRGIQVGGAAVEVVGLTRDTRVAKDASAQTKGAFDAGVEGGVSVHVEKDLTGEVTGQQDERVELPFAALAGSITLEAEDQLTLVVNEKVALTMKKSGDVVLSGATVSLDGDSIATKGSKAPHTSPAGPASKSAAAKKKPKKVVTPRFSVAEARCGDEVGLQATTAEIPDGQVTFTATGKPKGGTLGTAKGKLESAKAEAKWVTKKPKGTTEAELKGEAGGVSGKAAGKLKLKEYADVAAETKVIPCRAPNPDPTKADFGWTGKFDAEIRGGVLVITIKIKLLRMLGTKPKKRTDPQPAQGTPFSALRKLIIARDIERRLTNKWVMHRTGCRRGDKCGCAKDIRCCKLPVKVKVQFVESGHHHEVKLYQGAGRANCYNWTLKKTRENSWAHETGHLLGWYDEYPAANGGANGPVPRWNPDQPTHVMGEGGVVPKTYYWDFADWLEAKEGETFGTIKP